MQYSNHTGNAGDVPADLADTVVYTKVLTGPLESDREIKPRG